LKDCSEFLSKKMKMVISHLRKLPGMVRNWRRLEVRFNKPVISWSVFSLFQSLSRRRPWYYSGSGINETLDAAEMDNWEESSRVPERGELGGIEEYEDIDNPI
jgi:hypothetical protein